MRAPSPQPSREKKSKKYYESDSGESESDRDRRSVNRRHEEPKYDKTDVKSRRRKDDIDSESEEDPRSRHRKEGSKYERTDDRLGHGGKYVEPFESRGHSHVEAGRYEQQERHPEATRHASYTRQENLPSQRGFEMPGGFGHEHEAERTRHMSLNTLGNAHIDITHGQPQYMQHGPAYGEQYVASPGGNKSSGHYQVPISPYESRPQHSTSMSSQGGHYAQPEKFQYAPTPDKITYVGKTDPRHSKSYVQTAYPQVDLELEIEERKHREKRDDRKRRDDDRRDDDRRHDDRRRGDDHRHDDDRYKTSRNEPQVVEIHPGGSSFNANSATHGVHKLSISGQRPQTLSLMAPSGSHSYSGALPPGSPLLEAYHGTWQSIGMPSPMALPHRADSDLSDLELLEPEFDSDDADHRRPRKSILKKRVTIYDPEPDALALAASLKHSKPESKPIIDILPNLSDDNMMALRTEYKKHIKVSGKGINIAKHIKLKVPGNLGKIAYAIALGRWESEAHWANFWYQSGNSRRELLIESLMGRTNIEIRKIKEAFSDKRYNDNLEKCMQTELKKDKFRNAVLLALEERRQDDLSPLSKTRIKEDVQDLYKALVSKEGGETAMIEIIVVRSDTHLREVLREFELRFQRNFAREMIQKSRNLVV